MLKRSIKARLIAVFLCTALVISVAVGVHAFLMTNELLHKKADDVMSARCEAETAQLDATLNGIQRNVRLMSWYCLDRLDDPMQLTDPAFLAAFTDNMQIMFSVIAENVPGSVSYYLRFDPALTTPTSGFFYTRASDAQPFAATTITDLSLYDPEDTGRVGWYWQPLNAGQPLWMEPYTNLNNGVLMISYVIPVYQDGVFIGVVGMDIDFAYLQQEVSDIVLYENGYAYLRLADETPVHNHAGLIDHKSCIEASGELLNGMYLTLHASYQDVIRESYPILIRSAAIFLVLMLVFTFIIFHTTNRIIQPLRELTQAVRRMEEGEEIERFPGAERQDEIGVLSQAFGQMSEAIHCRISSINELAFQDSLTGLKNRAAYDRAVAHLNHRLSLGPVPFGLIVADSNDLKIINDHCGHEVGNAYICHICRIICDAFKHSPVYRVGGDEFVVLLEDRDLQNYEALVAQVDEIFAANPFRAGHMDVPCRIARGIAFFNPETDQTVNDVFVRADEAMYAHKRRLKGQP